MKLYTYVLHGTRPKGIFTNTTAMVNDAKASNWDAGLLEFKTGVPDDKGEIVWTDVPRTDYATRQDEPEENESTWAGTWVWKDIQGLVTPHYYGVWSYEGSRGTVHKASVCRFVPDNIFEDDQHVCIATVQGITETHVMRLADWVAKALREAEPFSSV